MRCRPANPASRLPCGGDPVARTHAPRATRLRALSRDDAPVFAVAPANATPTLEDVRDAIETCDLLAGSGRASCFAQFGVDAAAADAYFRRVAALQAALDASPGGGGGGETRRGGTGFAWPQLPRPW